jgi:hypothetical protein
MRNLQTVDFSLTADVLLREEPDEDEEEDDEEEDDEEDNDEDKDEDGNDGYSE